MLESMQPLHISPLHRYPHDHPPVTNVNEVHDAQLSVGDRVADRVASLVGSWPFIITQSFLLLLWIGFNVFAVVRHMQGMAFDPYPFILLNLALSFQAAYTGPIVMMSQNRQAEKDRLVAQSDFECNQTAEQEIRLIMEHLKFQSANLDLLQAKLEAMEAKLSKG